MVSENDVRSRLLDTEAQLEALDHRIPPLQAQVGAGTEEWTGALQTLAECYRRRQALQIQRESLTWVLAR
jgi:hypothetical protein